LTQWNRNIVAFFTLAVLFASHTVAAPEAQWRGKNRDGVYNEQGLLKTWPEEGPSLIWSAEGIGYGFASVAATDSVLYVTGAQDSTEYLTALTMDGQTLWRVPFGRTWQKNRPGARATPTVEDGKVYIVSGHGEISRIDATSGRLDWARNGLVDFEGKQGGWGTAESLLLVDDKVIYTPGGDRTTMVALDRDSGETVWESESLGDQTAYTSPILVYYAGKQMIVGVTGRWVVGVNAEDGSFLWTYPYAELDPPGGGVSINGVTPLYHDGQIYVTSGYNHVGAMLKLSEDGRGVALVWSDTTLDCHHGGVVRVGDYIYGSNWINNGKGHWCCVEWKTGKTLYETDWVSKGSVIYADGMLYCYSERRGHFGLVPVDPGGFSVVSSFQIELGDGQHWSHPTIQDGIMYVRHGDVVMAYQISGE
jgi:outer membrane protein assembly factor BamB